MLNMLNVNFKTLSQEKLLFTNPIKINNEFYNTSTYKSNIFAKQNDKKIILNKLSSKLNMKTNNKIENLKLLYEANKIANNGNIKSNELQQFKSLK
jgi:hypothetical protein